MAQRAGAEAEEKTPLLVLDDARLLPPALLDRLRPPAAAATPRFHNAVYVLLSERGRALVPRASCCRDASRAGRAGAGGG